MNSLRLGRREILQKCLALGSLTILSAAFPSELIAAWEEREKLSRKLTPWNELGPFYKKSAPHTASLRAPVDRGIPLSVSGQVRHVRGDIVPDAKLEICQTDTFEH